MWLIDVDDPFSDPWFNALVHAINTIPGHRISNIGRGIIEYTDISKIGNREERDFITYYSDEAFELWRKHDWVNLDRKFMLTFDAHIYPRSELIERMLRAICSEAKHRLNYRKENPT